MDNIIYRCRRKPARQTSEKDILCSTGRADPVQFIRQVAHGTSFLSRQRDGIAHFSFGACTVHTFLKALHIQRIFIKYMWYNI